MGFPLGMGSSSGTIFLYNFEILAWSGLENYGFKDDAQRVAYRWLYTLTKAFFDFNGVIPEKFDIVNMTHKVDVEYGNVGSDFKYVVKEGFGWMNASFQIGLNMMSIKWRRALGTLTTPAGLGFGLKSIK
jgi:alpha,alpha-trehalase